eukprot:COSAG02_NODE_48535_length_333_cov_0.658120_1_plen_83_part_10
MARGGGLPRRAQAETMGDHGDKPDMAKNYPLQHEWTLWVGKQHKGGNWGDSMVALCDFKTVQEFAQYWCAAPLSSSPAWPLPP